MKYKLMADEIKKDSSFTHQLLSPVFRGLGIPQLTKEVAQELFGHLDPEVVHKIARGNAIKLFNLPFE